MGCLTPILIRNDCVHIFKDKKTWKQICEGIYYACMRREREVISIHSKNAIYSNYIESLGYAHADCPRTIIVYGNTWIDVSREGYKKVDRIDKEYIGYLEKCVRIAESDIDSLKNKIKELKQRNKENEENTI